MDTFYIICTLFFSSFCAFSHSQPSNPTSNASYENLNRCDTFIRTHEMKFIWAIHQFSVHETLETPVAREIISPRLHSSSTGGYEWEIRVIPNGVNNRNKSISLKIYRFGYNIFEEVLAIEANVSIIDHEEETLFCKNLTQKHFQVGNYLYWEDFRGKNDYFRNRLLQNDTLTLSIDLRWFSDSYNQVSRQDESSSELAFENTIRCDTYMKSYEIDYIWAIHQFSLHEDLLGDREIKTPVLQAPTTDTYEWRIEIVPNSTDDKNTSIISLYATVGVKSGSTVGEILASIDAAIIDHEKRELFSAKMRLKKFENRERGGMKDFCKKDHFFRNQLLRNDTLTLSINLRWFAGPWNDVSPQHNISIARTNLIQSQ
ncbi:uncharacterized protein LOC135848163 [Planococcus citri]|uniref:uncharacterized protein LOC135848163 n=1 Tax=Planococcus citri TaxID=170843 RepID=UPI0031F8924D